MNEKKAKELTDSIFDKLNDQERVYLAWIHNQKNKEIKELKEENNFLKLNNPQMNLEHFRVVKENKRKIDNLRLVNKRLNNIINKLEKELKEDYKIWMCNSRSNGKSVKFGIDVCKTHFYNRLQELKGSSDNEK